MSAKASNDTWLYGRGRLKMGLVILGCTLISADSKVSMPYC